MALSFLLFDLWWVALSYLAFPRIICAWGMDRMGPKWFTDVNAARIEAEPKTKDWNKRAKKSTDKIWYNTNFSDW